MTTIGGCGPLDYPNWRVDVRHAMPIWLDMRKLLPALMAAGTVMAATLTIYVETQHHARQLQVLRVGTDATFTARSMRQTVMDQAFEQPAMSDFVVAYSSRSKRHRG